jgi:hypothetical protein
VNIFIEALMSSLKEIGRNHPLATATIGATGGLGGGLIAWLDNATRLFQFVSVFFGALLAVGAFLLFLPKGIRFARNWWRKGLLNADRDSEPPFPPLKGL